MAPPSASKLTAQSLDLLDARLRPMIDAYLLAIPVAGATIAIISGDQAYHYSYGVKAISKPDPVTIDTSFNIGSCSKAFTSALMASLVADNLVSWDDLISRYVPEFQLYDPEITRQVTLRDLSANRLGLPRSGMPEYGSNPDIPAEFLFDRLRFTPPAYPLRDRFTYVNAGHRANAVAIGRITGKGFLPSLRERILHPLGMTATSGGAATEHDLKDLAGWHCPDNGQLVEVPPIFTDQNLGSGGMVVSGADALQWLRFNLGRGTVGGQQIVAADAISETYRPHSLAQSGADLPSLFYPASRMAAYALGWGVSDFEGHPLVCHSGSDFGISAMTLLFPDSGIGIAVYSNSLGFDTVSLSYAIAAVLLDMPPRDWRAWFDAVRAPSPNAAEQQDDYKVPDDLDLAIYAGSYSHPADGILSIELTSEGLKGRLELGNRLSFALIPCGENCFTGVFDDPCWRHLAGSRKGTIEFVCNEGRPERAVFALTDPVPREFCRVS